MPPTLAAPDRQVTWKPVYILRCAAFPYAYATRDIDKPGAPGVPFEVGDSEVGGSDLVGGGAGPDAIYARAGIIGTNPTITRRIADSFRGLIEVQDVTIVLANVDGALSGDYRGAPFTLSRYDAYGEVERVEWTGLIAQTRRNRGSVTVYGTNVDLAILEDPIPKGGVIDRATYPLAHESALGQSATWLFGNVFGLPLPYVRDDTTASEFDYLICRGTCLTFEAAYRVGSNNTRFAIAFTECSVAEQIENGNMERWTAGDAGPPTGWTLTGAGATAPRNTTAGQFWDGVSSVNLIRAGADATLSQDLVDADHPIEFWRGRTVRATARVRSATVAVSTVTLSDDVDATSSTPHTGGGAFELLTVEHTVDAAATAFSIVLTRITSDGTTQFDAVRVYVKATSWEDAMRVDLYPGFTAIRFFSRQDDSSDNLFTVLADAHGLASLRNPVRAARTILTDATHGLGRTADAISWGVAEMAACLHYDDAVRLDDPELFFDFEENLDVDTVAIDKSGHERSGTYVAPYQATAGAAVSDSGDQALYLDGVDTGYVEVPYADWMDSQTISMEVFYRPAANDSITNRPIMTRTIGGVGGTSIASLTHVTDAFHNGEIRWTLEMTGPTSTSIQAFSIPSGELGTYLHILGTYSPADGQRLYRNGVLVDGPDFPAGTLSTGVGPLLIAKHTTLATLAYGAFDKLAVYTSVLSAERAAAHYEARLIDQNPVDAFDDVIESTYVPTLYYPLTETSGTVASDVMTGGLDMAYVGSPTLGVAGPMDTLGRGGSSKPAVRFAANSGQYVALTGGNTFAASAASVVIWYRPALYRAHSGIVEKTIAGAVNTQWLLFQQDDTGAGLSSDSNLIWRIRTSTTVYSIRCPLALEDAGRWMLLGATYAGGTMTLYKNGVAAASGAYAGTPSSGAGDMFVGKLGGGIYPCHGDVGRLAVWIGTALTADQMAWIATAGTWLPGGLPVDAALTEPRPAQEWLEQLLQVADLRLGFATAGTITATTGLTAPTTIRLALRDGSGDGERNLADCREGGKPRLDDTVRDLIVHYRPDLTTGDYTRTVRREVSTRTDAQGRRIGRDLDINLDVVRDDTTADRVADRLAKRLIAGEETCEVVTGQEARQLIEGDLVQLTDALMGYDSVVMEVKQVEKELIQIGATLRGWDEQATNYTPAIMPVGSEAG